MSRSLAVTRGIRVEVAARYLPDRSFPEKGRWMFAYTIRITNQGDTRVQLVSRHWVITDAHGRTEEVRGPGVIGEQPVLAPGESFEYTSGCPLPTPFGSMRGTYQMVSDEGGGFDVEIAPFALTEPHSVQ
jgi:ApaG protein